MSDDMRIDHLSFGPVPVSTRTCVANVLWCKSISHSWVCRVLPLVVLFLQAVEGDFCDL